jgi:hypothetical protein
LDIVLGRAPWQGKVEKGSMRKQEPKIANDGQQTTSCSRKASHQFSFIILKMSQPLWHLDLGLLISSIEMIHYCCLKHKVSCALLWQQLWEMNGVHLTSHSVTRSIVRFCSLPKEHSKYIKFYLYHLQTQISEIILLHISLSTGEKKFNLWNPW